MTMIATRSAQDSCCCGGTARTSPPGAAAGPAPTVSTPVAHAALTSLCPPYATGSSTATRFPRSAPWRASWRHCCWPAASASRAKTSSRTARTQFHRQPCTPKVAMTRDTPAASNASASKAPSQTHSGPGPACSAAGCTYGASLGFACGRRVSEIAWFGWWRLGLVSQVMQQHSVELPRRRCLF